VLCNNAGGGAGHTAAAALWETPLSQWQEVFQLNFFGSLNVLRGFLPKLLSQTHDSHIVNTAAMTGLVPNLQVATYSAAKHALVTLSESLVHQLAGARPAVRVSVLLPGPTDTEAMRAAHAQAAPVRAEGIPPTQVPVVDPDSVADIVFSAIGTDRFCLFSNPWSAKRIRTRFEPMLAAAAAIDRAREV
jgi:1-deoxy-11beta-hydroxypentalenate dehydrogenase